VTPDVLAHGDDRPPGRRWTGLLTGFAALALLVAGVAGSRATGDHPSPTPSPSPSRTLLFPAPTVGDLFAEHVAVHPTGELTPALLPDALPGFVLGTGRAARAYAAVAPAGHARPVLGWCPATRTFEDATGTARFDENGLPFTDETAALAEYPTRERVGGGIDVGVDRGGNVRAGFGDRDAPPRRCTARSLVWPPSPPAAARLEDAARGYRTMHGRYVLTPETQAFCPGPPPGTACGAGGWEVYGLNALPADDLAESYVYEGDFVVRSYPATGRFAALLLPGVRLVRRTGVGTVATCGNAVRARHAGGADRLVLRPDEGADVEFRLRPDVTLHLGQGRTGLGVPHQAPLDALTRLLRDQPEPRVCLVLDSRGAVMRVVVEVFEAVATA
jgi:hypothetical protein